MSKSCTDYKTKINIKLKNKDDKNGKIKRKDMTVKEDVLRILENRRGAIVSGTEMATELSVSRNAIWKAIQSLESDGYVINAGTNKGYCLSKENDVVSAQGIRRYLKQDYGNFPIEVIKKVTSTNERLKLRAGEGAEEGLILIAEEQSEGKGRRGRNFYSPHGTGIYMSILLRPQLKMEKAIYITTAAAVAVAKAIESVTEQKAYIKWVNDIFCNDKKVCGILTEASLDVESGGLAYAVLGIGINTHRPNTEFPKEIQNTAGYLYINEEKDFDIRNKLIAEVINNFMQYYVSIENKAFMQEYRERSFLIGKTITYYSGKEERTAFAKDVDDEARLLVRYEDGSEDALNSGEVTLHRN